MPERTCQQCGERLSERSRRDKIYCSTRCQRAAYMPKYQAANRDRLREAARALWASGAEERRAVRLAANAGRTCEACGAELSASSPTTRRFCGDRCRLAAAKAKVRDGLVEIPVTKLCRRCKLSKPAAEFRNDDGRADGLFPWCKTCKSESDRQSYQKHRAARRIALRAYALANRDVLLEYYRQRYRANPRPQIEQAARWRIDNPEKYSNIQKGVKARRRSRERLGLTARDRELSRSYREAISADLCLYCGAPGEHDDHKVPLARGGTDHWWNLARACAPCNLAKWTMTADEFVLLRQAGQSA